MRILLIHPQDALLEGPWARSKWDRIIDLGHSGVDAYLNAAATLGATVSPMTSLGFGFEPIHRVRDLFMQGYGFLQDEFGCDWWELTAPLLHSDLETVVRLLRLSAGLSNDDEVHFTRSGLHARVLAGLLGARVCVFPATRKQPGSARHYARVVKNLSAQQLLDVFWDKTDPGYRWRGRLAKRPSPSKHPVVLLPTAYINVTRTGLAYAASSPGTSFLLVATRRSGWADDLPSNVNATWLKTYAVSSPAKRKVELRGLIDRWNLLRKRLEGLEEFRVLSQNGRFDELPRRFATGLEIRDAWRTVLEREPVQAVLCADDSNPNTHMPLLLAKACGIPTVACHHGALDGRYMFKQARATVILAKGRMEQDYLVRVCGVPRELVETGAPAKAKNFKTATGARNSIVFFSEAYEVSGGRARDFYADVLPRLADIANKEGKELVVKLHPFESLAERRRIASSVLTAEQGAKVRWVEGRLEETLLANAWFAVTVLSTVAVECAGRGVPCFLCRWLECWPYGYIEQFTRFGLGIKLERPEDIYRIPQMLAAYTARDTVLEDIVTPIDPDRLSTILGSKQPGPRVLSAN